MNGHLADAVVPGSLAELVCGIGSGAGNRRGTSFEACRTDSCERIQGRWQAVWSQPTAIGAPSA